MIAGTWIGLMVLLMGWSRLVALDLSLWLDEAFTGVNYVRGGPSSVLGDDFTVNNHVLFSLLAWVISEALGESEVALRLGSAVPAIGAGLLVTWWMWRQTGPLSAAIFALLVATSPLHFSLSRSARGYGLAMLAMAGLLVFGHREVRGRPWAIVGYSLAGAIGVLTVPVFLLPLAFSSGVVLFLGRRWSRMAAGWVLIGIFSAVIYGPRLGQLVEASGQEFGQVLAWYELIYAWFFHLAEGNALVLMQQDGASTPAGTFLPVESMNSGRVVIAVVASLLLLASCAVAVRMWGRRDSYIIWGTSLPIIGTYVILWLMGAHVAGRFVSFLLIPLFALVGVGLAAVLEGLPASARPSSAGIGVLLTVAMAWGFVADTERWHRLPYEAYRDAAAIAKATSRPIITDSRRPVGFEFYLGQSFEAVEQADVSSFCDSDVVFIHHRYLNDQIEPCGDRAELIGRPKQIGRGGSMELWTFGHGSAP
jgi:hypothetical protein